MLSYYIVPGIVIALFFSFWAWMFVDLIRNESIVDNPNASFGLPPNTKQSWISLFIITNVVAAGLYYFTEYRHKH